MQRAGLNAIMGSLLLLVCTWSSIGSARAGRGAKSVSAEVHFRDGDLRAQRIAKRLLAKEIAEEKDMPSELQTLWTAWVNVSHGGAPELFVMYGCSPTGNCDLYGFEPTQSGYRLILESLAQRCAILASSHGGRRDVSAYMHGSATDGTVKTYWWRKNRYVRVSERDLLSRDWDH